MIPDCGPECEEALREIERFLDGELEPGLRAVVASHLSSCTPCTERAEFRRHVKELIASKCSKDAMPNDLLARVKSLLDIEGASST
ncbi:MAG TPA: mycothiol system anti-sigma-R factor [Actinomycetota bacterium]